MYCCYKTNQSIAISLITHVVGEAHMALGNPSCFGTQHVHCGLINEGWGEFDINLHYVSKWQWHQAHNSYTHIVIQSHEW